MITLLDGAVGTTLWKIAENNNIEKKPVWTYNVEAPEFVHELHKRYIDAGSKIILTNTFNANELEVKRTTSYEPELIVKTGVEIAKFEAKNHDVKVCLAVGPLSKLLEPYGELSEEECFEVYDNMIAEGVSAGCDLILLQTFFDLNMMKIAVNVAKRYSLPIFCSMTFERKGKTIFGNSVSSVCEELEALSIDAIGLNCSLGPTPAIPIIQMFHEVTKLPLIFKPNAGLPISDSKGKVISSYTPEQFAEEIKPALKYVSYVGGCCGTDDSYIKAIREII